MGRQTGPNGDSTTRASATVAPVSQTERLTLTRHLLPLPHELSVTHKVVVSPASVRVASVEPAGPAAQAAVARLRQALRQQGDRPPGQGFEISLSMTGDALPAGLDPRDVERLRGLPNSDQAYLVRPVGNDRLVIAALTERGLLYGAMTLCQLIGADAAGMDTVSIPLATITDWPDFDDRGFWHMPVRELPWLAEMKLNHLHCSAFFKALPDGRVAPYMTAYEPGDPPSGKDAAALLAGARSFGAEIVPGLTHMDFWEQTCPGFAAKFPELVGKGERAKCARFATNGQRVPCASHPRMTELLTEVMSGIASWGASEAYVWMSEYPGGQCECESCLKEGQFQAEVRSTLAAWRKVRANYPAFKLRLFFGAGGFLPGDTWFEEYSKSAVDEILAAVPNDVRMCISLGFDDDVMEEFVAGGGRLTRCFIVSMAVWDVYSSEHIRKRMQALHGRRVHGATQFFYNWADDVQGTFGLQAAALAEFSWNAGGRSVGEFAEAWATRQGHEHPVEFGQWAAAISKLVAEGRSMEKFIWTGSWLSDVKLALKGQPPARVLKDLTPERLTIEECRKAFEWSRFFEPKRLSLDEEILVRTIAFGGANSDSLGAAIAEARRAVRLAGGLGLKAALAHSELLLRYCELEKAGQKLVKRYRGRKGKDLAAAEVDEFKSAAQAFLTALKELRVGLGKDDRIADGMRQGCIDKLEKAFADTGK